MKKSFLFALVLTVCFPSLLWAANAGDFTIAIDSGHGPQTGGKRSCPFPREVTHSYNGQTITVRAGEQFREHVGNTGIAENLAQILTGIGFKVQRVAFNDGNPEDDGDPGLGERLTQIRNSGAQVSVSCHHDAFGDGQNFNSANGLSIWVWNGGGNESRALAEKILPKLVAVRGQTNRGIRENVFALCDVGRSGCRASILIEHNFMTNEKEATELFCNPEVWHGYAVATAQGICEFLGVPYSEQAVSGGGGESAEPMFSDAEMAEMGWGRAGEAPEASGDPTGDVDMDKVPKSELALSMDAPVEEAKADPTSGAIATDEDLPSKKIKKKARRKSNSTAALLLLAGAAVVVVAGIAMTQNKKGGRKSGRK